jgi:hypothetical protein
MTDNGRVSITGDNEGEATEPPAVRILPPDGRHEIRRISPEEDPSRRWLPIALGLVAATLGGLFVLTRPDGGPEFPATTVPAVLLSEFEAPLSHSTTDPETTLVDDGSTDPAEQAAVDSVREFFAVVNAGDAAQLPLPDAAPGIPHFELPSLGGADLDWWNGGTEDIDHAAVEATLGYLTVLNTQVEIEACTTSVRLGEIDTVRAVCGFTVTSDLMTELGILEGRGRFEANFQAGVLTRLDMHSAPSLSAWQSLSEWAADTAPDNETVGRIGLQGAWERSPIFTEASAVMHLDLADQFTATMLTPGTTRITDTPFGTMEWRWAETLPGDIFAIEAVAHTDFGFVAVGRESADDSISSAWRSDDGFEWEPLPAPEVDSMFNIVPFRNGLISAAWDDDSSVVTIFDGDEWTSLPLADQGEFQSVAHIVPKGDAALLVTAAWIDDNAPPLFDVVMLGSDNTLTPGVVPWDEDYPYPMGVVAFGDGYLVATVPQPPASDFRVSYTEDGANWTVLNDSVELEGAGYVWRMDRHRNRLLVFGELDEPVCTDTGSGQTCRSVQAVWTSQDGIEWTNVNLGPVQPIISYLGGPGPLGLIAIGESDHENRSPQPVYFSVNGESWERVENLTLYEPGASWAWMNLAAVSEDTVVIPRISLYEDDMSSSFSNPEQYWLIVGKLIEG